MSAGKILSKPPFNIFVNPEIAKRKSPWEINLSELLSLFLKTVTSAGLIDMNAAGTAALSSATIYRLKVETLFFFERLKMQKRQVVLSEPPHFIIMPFRYEVYSTTIDELFEELARVLKQSKEYEQRGVEIFQLYEAEPPQFEDYLQTLEYSFQEFRKILMERLGPEGKAFLSELLAGLKPVEAARVFILVLFAANKGEVIIEQQEEDEDALIISVGQIE